MAVIIRCLFLAAMCAGCLEGLCQHNGENVNEEMKDYIYILTLLPEYQDEANWTDEVTMIANSHFNYLKELHDTGQAFFVGRTDYDVVNKNNFGIVVFKAKNQEEAAALMSNDPAVKNGLMKAEVHPFKVVLM
ncbi:YciI family protein [Fulvivirga ulvae]|uniref:YciI family protein n=1 Tax=Fulvivirga ulvae TaxID=2904245 RepID=UPI001F2C3B56|nr:YciI family protein [Fulvivirga ulvae]UII34353.1 YciI family protein [Fulvivirga ulvae]